MPERETPFHRRDTTPGALVAECAGDYGTGEGAQVPIVDDLITVGWWTYWWRPDLKRLDAILTTD